MGLQTFEQSGLDDPLNQDGRIHVTRQPEGHRNRRVSLQIPDSSILLSSFHSFALGSQGNASSVRGRQETFQSFMPL